MAPSNLVIVGASLAGLRAAEALRRQGHDGRLTVIGDEPHLPYDRPPLSKQILRGEWQPEQIVLRRQPYEELDLDLRLETRATALEIAEQRVELDDGSFVSYDGLLIATGAAARRLPGLPDLEGIHVLRGLDDALAIRAGLEQSPRVCVVGAGFIGAEVAASARQLGLEVTMVDPLPVPCQRGLGVEMGGLLAGLHRDHGVDLRLGTGVTGFEGDSRIERIRLSDGSAIETDLVVVGIGAVPATDWLKSSGLELRDGVVCDSSCATRAPGVFAAGDVARWDHPLFGDIRVEHWTNAVEQGVYCASRLLEPPPGGDVEPPEPFQPVPMFWSDQYDRMIQAAGHAAPDDEVKVVMGSAEEREFVALYGRAGRLTGVLAFNRARDLMKFRRALSEVVSWEDALKLAAV